MYSEPRAWKRLISDTALSKHERVSLITYIFSDSNEVESVRLLSGDDAQAFIDMIDEVSVHTMIEGLVPKITPYACCLGFGTPPTTGILEVFALFI